MAADTLSRDAARWDKYEAVVAEGSGASANERAIAAANIERLRKQYGGRPTVPRSSSSHARVDEEWWDVWRDHQQRRQNGERKRSPPGPEFHRRAESDDFFSRSADEARKEAERKADADAVKYQQSRCESIPGWRSYGELGELWRKESAWTTDEHRRCKDVENEANRFARLSDAEVATFLRAVAWVYDGVGDDYGRAQARDVLRDLAVGRLRAGHQRWIEEMARKPV